MDLDEYLSRPGAETSGALASRMPSHPNGAMVRQWRTHKRPNAARLKRPRPGIVAELELASHGLITCEDERPELGWYRIRDPRWPHPKGRPLHDVSSNIVPASRRRKA